MSNFKNQKQNDKGTFYLRAFLVPIDDLGELLKIKGRDPFLSISLRCLLSTSFESNPVRWQSTAMPQPYLKVLDGSGSLLGKFKSLAQSVWSITAWSLLTLPHIKSFFSVLTVPPICVPLLPEVEIMTALLLPTCLCSTSFWTQSSLPKDTFPGLPDETPLEKPSRNTFSWVTVWVLCLFEQRFRPSLVCWRCWPLAFCLLLSPWCLNCRRSSINIYRTKQSVAAFLL